MLKKPFLLSLAVVLAVVALVLAASPAQSQAGANIKKAAAERQWKMSGHAAKDSEVFKHWDAEGSIPASCAKCHSSHGFRDFLGVDGSAGGTVDKPAALGTTVDCLVCHTDNDSGVLRRNPSVQFPSGIVVNDMGPEGICMECHQGRESKSRLDTKIAGAGVPNDDTSSTKLTFSNIHYFAAAATQFGTVVKGGYEYAGKEYDARFSHITGYNACNTCHNPHSLEVNLKACNTCHTGIKDPKDIRYIGSMIDYDGDGDIAEGMYYEIEHIKDIAYGAIRRYAQSVLNRPIVYNPATHPYWFFDGNNNGVLDATDTTSYNAFSARLLRAAYNYQTSQKDTNAYAHNGKYIIELLYDSIEDLNTKLTSPAASSAPIDMSALHRGDEGHFDGSGMPWRDWDDSATYTVPASCSKCHSATGLAKFIELGQPTAGLTAGEPVSNGMLCTTCHTSPPALRQVPVVNFVSSGLTASLGDASNLCMICHQGRAAKATLDTAMAGKPATQTYSLTNIHYFPEAAVFLGHEVQGGYEFPNKVYSGRQPYPNHNGMFNTCVQCHMGTKMVEAEHNWTMRNHNVAEPMKEYCVGCHGQDVSQTFKGFDPKRFKFSQIRPGNIPDYDSDGNTTESLRDEIRGLENTLATVIQNYVLINARAAILFSAGYWYKDLNGNGILDSNETGSSNRYQGTAPWLKAAYNLRVSTLAEHGFIHNARYLAELLVDSIQHLGGEFGKYTWR